MLPIEKVKKWLIENRTDENGNLNLSGLDFSDFDGDINIRELKAKKSLDQSWQKVGGDLRQNYQEAGGNLYQDSQKVRLNLFQDKQEVGWCITQDEQKAEDECKCVEPDYKAEYEKLRKELYEADKKNETLLWVLGKIKEASK